MNLIQSQQAIMNKDQTEQVKKNNDDKKVKDANLQLKDQIG